MEKEKKWIFFELKTCMKTMQEGENRLTKAYHQSFLLF
jgi:hypothetical protein